LNATPDRTAVDTAASFSSRQEPDFRALFEAAPGLYLVLDSDLIIRAANDAYCRATMTKRDEIVGRRLFDVFPDNPDDAQADGTRNLRASLHRVLQLGLPDAMAVQKYDVRRPEGVFEERYWSPLNIPLQGADGSVRWIIHRVEDVTELVRIQQSNTTRDQIALDQQRHIESLRVANEELARLNEANQRLAGESLSLARIVEFSQDAIIGKSLSGIVTSFNPAAERLFGYSRSEIVGQPVTLLFPEDLRHEESLILSRLAHGEIIDPYETRRVRKDGREIVVSLSISPIRASSGEIVGASKIVRDITERKQAEERLNALQAEILHLSRWNTAGMMASMLAHELNQPLAACLNYVRAAERTLQIAEGEKSARIRELLDKAAVQTVRAGAIIKNLRDFTERRPADRAPQKLDAVLEEALALGFVGAGVAGVSLHTSFDSALPPVPVDRVQIQQVLVNLVRNAVEAMQSVEERRLAVSVTGGEPGFVLVTVTDTGPGLPATVTERLFQPFVTTKTGSGGMGMGLMICQAIIKAHGGRIWAEPQARGGTSFRFTLPVGDEADPS